VLIGADGVHSTVRRLINPDAPCALPRAARIRGHRRGRPR
jgi:2-polyprenyl-6-methoxyphenol hydroxylase-like FAD-dependent oxidoreductase